MPVYLDLDTPGEAAKLLEENKSRVEKTGDLLDLANTNYQLAGLYYETGKYRNALQCFELARSTFISLANTAKHYSEYRECSLKAADCYQAMAVIYNALDMREYAIQHLEIARDIFSRHGSSDSEEGLARCNVSLGVSYSGLNQVEKALGLYQEAETIFQRLGLELQVALCKKNMAAIYDSDLGDQETSLKLYEQARLIYEKHGIQHKVQAVDRDIAIVKRNRGKKPRGYQGIGEIKSSVAKEKVIAFVKAASGGITQANEAINLGEALLTELKEEEEPRFVWQIHFFLARIYRAYASLWSYYAVGNPLFKRTLKRAGFSLESFITSLPDEKRTLWNRLTQERRFDEITFIEAFYDDPHILAIEEGREGELAEEDAQRATQKLMVLYYFAYFKRYKFEQLEHAQRHAQAATKILESLRSTYVSEQAKIDFMRDKHDIFNFAVDICLDLEEYLSAFVQVEQAKSRSFVEMLANTNIQVPSTLPLALLNREQELIDSLTGKVQEIKNVQKSHPLMDRRDDVFHISHSLGNRDAEPPRMYTPSYDEVHRELEAIRSLFIKTEPEYVSLRRGESFDPQGLRNFLRSQTKKTAIIEFYMGDISVHVTEAGDTSDPLEKSSLFDEVFDARITYGSKGIGYMQLHGQQLLALVWGSQSDELFMHRTILTSENLENLVHKALYEIRQQEPGTNFAELGRRLLQPLQSYIQGYELLIIIPCGPLHNIPFHALPYQEKTLIDFFEVVYTPSLAVLHQCRNKDVAPGNSSFVLGYNNREQDYINYIEEEAEEVAKLLETQALLGENATKQALISHSREKHFVHLVCHAEFSPSQPMASSVYLAHGEYLSASEFSSLRLNADLVTLSACETGLTQALSGDELMGLTRSLLYAGAKSVLVSLWRVKSSSTKEFMCRFYELLLQGMNKSAALRQVQIEMRDRYEQPLYWSPFILVGDWQ